MTNTSVVTPRVGDTIMVKHGSDGDGKTQQVKPKLDIITATYIGGKVCVGIGDVYEIRPCSQGAKWETFVPKREKK